MVARRAPATRISSSRTLRTTVHSTIGIVARHRLEPYRQGALDGLCGLYGIINALRLAVPDNAPLSKAQSKELFAAGVVYLDSKREFREAAVGGMTTRPRFELARHLAKLVSTSHCPVVVERPDHSASSSIEDVFGWIDDSLLIGMPVMAALMGGTKSLHRHRRFGRLEALPIR